MAGPSCKRTSIYRVSFVWDDERAADGAFYVLSSGVHEDSPTIGTAEPYQGPLCAHELAHLKGQDRAVSFPPSWSFTVKKA